MRRTFVVLAVLATGLVAAPAFATTLAAPVGSCGTGVWVGGVGVGVQQENDGVTACVDLPIGAVAGLEATVDQAAAVADDEAWVGAGVYACQEQYGDPYPCVYAGSTEGVRLDGTAVHATLMPSACVDLYANDYDHCPSLWGFVTVDPSEGAVNVVDATVLVCDFGGPDWWCPANVGTGDVTAAVTKSTNVQGIR